MSSLRVTNIESHSDTSSPTVDEKVKIKNSSGDVLLEVDGKNMSGVGTVFVGPGIVTCTNFRATEKFMVDTAYISAGSVGIGSTTTDGRDAGIGTMVGSMIYNADTNSVQVYKPTTGWQAIDNTGDAYPLGMTATGGFMNEYLDPGPGKYYRSHTFNATGTFEVTSLGTPDMPLAVDYLVVGGGGGAGVVQGSSYDAATGGGGAGGFVTGSFTAAVESKAVTIGAGGIVQQAGSSATLPGSGGDGGDSGGTSKVKSDYDKAVSFIKVAKKQE